MVNSSQQKNWWKADNSFIDDGHIEKMGVPAFAVYCVLLRHKDSTGRAFPSVSRMCEKTGLSRPCVIGCLKKLTSLSYIERVSQGKAKGQNSVYLVKDQAQLVNDVNQSLVNQDNQLTRLTSKPSEPVLVNEINQSLVNDVYPKKTIDKKTIKEDPSLKSAGEQEKVFDELASQSESDRNLESTTAIAVQGKAPLQSTDELGSGSGYSAAFSSPTKNIAGERINQHYSQGMPEWRSATGEIDPGFVEFVAKGYKKDGAILPRNTWAKQLIKKDASRAADLWEEYQQQLNSRRQAEQAIAAASYPSPAEPYNPPKRQIETRFTDEELRRTLIGMGLRVKESREVAAL